MRVFLRDALGVTVDSPCLVLGAGLGILRKFSFDIAIIDEASQITEPCALIPFVKGIKKGIMVGDQCVIQNRMREGMLTRAVFNCDQWCAKWG